MAFDRLLYIDRLTEAGVTDTVARAHSEALLQAMSENMVTKADLRELADRSDARFAEVDRRFDAADDKIDAVEHRLDAKIDALEKKLDGKIDALDKKLEGKIDALDKKLESKIELLRRDLIIAGGGGVALLISVMIGLKLLG